jgi:DNA replication and repair protein RecF
MRMAQFLFLARQTSLRPILMLDDIYDKLDESRMFRLLSICRSEPFGQIMISDTHHERIPRLLASMGIPCKTVQPVFSTAPDHAET